MVYQKRAVTHFRIAPRFKNARIGRPHGAAWPDQKEEIPMAAGFGLYLESGRTHRDPTGVQWECIQKGSQRFEVVCPPETAAKALGYASPQDAAFQSDERRTARGFRGAMLVLEALSEAEVNALQTPDGVITKDEWLEATKKAAERDQALADTKVAEERALVSESKAKSLERAFAAQEAKLTELREKLEKAAKPK